MKNYCNTLGALGALATLMLAPLTCQAAWQAKGPVGVSIEAMAMDNSNEDLLFFGSGGIYSSSSGGTAWQYKKFRFRDVKALANNQNCTPPLLAAAWNEVYGSSDDGATWTIFQDSQPHNQESINAIATSSSCTLYYGTINGVYSTGTHGLAGEEISSLAVDQEGNVYAATEGGEIYKSTDDGVSWGTPILSGEVMVEALQAVGSNIVIAGALPNGFYWSEDGGATFEQRVNGLPGIDGSGLYAVEAVGMRDGKLYAVVITSIDPLTHTVYKSEDNGLNWTSTDSSITQSTEIRHLLINSSGTVYAGTDAGLYRSQDSGGSWTMLDPGVAAMGFNHQVTEDGEGTLFVNSVTAGVYASTDRGETWTPIGAGDAARAEVSVLVDAGDNLYNTDNNVGGVRKSVDRGQTWQRASNGLPSDMMGSLELYSEVYSLARDGNDRIYAGLDDGSVYFSDNKAQTWAVTAGPLPMASSRVNSLAGGSGGTVYAGTEMNGVYKSSNGGATWTQVNNGFEPPFSVSPGQLALDRSSGNLYVLLGGKLYTSGDDAANWSSITFTTNCTIPSAFTVDSRGTLYAVLCHGAVAKSTDKGATWSDMSDGFVQYDNVDGINIAGISTDSADNLFLVTTGSGIYKYDNPSSKWNLYLPAILDASR